LSRDTGIYKAVKKKSNAPILTTETILIIVIAREALPVVGIGGAVGEMLVDENIVGVGDDVIAIVVGLTTVVIVAVGFTDGVAVGLPVGTAVGFGDAVVPPLGGGAVGVRVTAGLEGAGDPDGWVN